MPHEDVGPPLKRMRTSYPEERTVVPDDRDSVKKAASSPLPRTQRLRNGSAPVEQPAINGASSSSSPSSPTAHSTVGPVPEPATAVSVLQPFEPLIDALASLMSAVVADEGGWIFCSVLIPQLGDTETRNRLYAQVGSETAGAYFQRAVEMELIELQMRDGRPAVRLIYQPQVASAFAPATAKFTEEAPSPDAAKPTVAQRHKAAALAAQTESVEHHTFAELRHFLGATAPNHNSNWVPFGVVGEYMAASHPHLYRRIGEYKLRDYLARAEERGIVNLLCMPERTQGPKGSYVRLVQRPTSDPMIESPVNTVTITPQNGLPPPHASLPSRPESDPFEPPPMHLPFGSPPRPSVPFRVTPAGQFNPAFRYPTANGAYPSPVQPMVPFNPPFVPSRPLPPPSKVSDGEKSGYARFMDALHTVATAQGGTHLFVDENKFMQTLGSSRISLFVEAGAAGKEEYLDRAARMDLIERKGGGIRLMSQCRLEGRTVGAPDVALFAPLVQASKNRDPDGAGLYISELRNAMGREEAMVAMHKAGVVSGDFSSYVRQAAASGALRSVVAGTWVKFAAP